jgi:hypothetical protein
MRVPLIRHHPKAPDASLQSLRSLAGIFALEGPMPSTKLLGEDEHQDEDRPPERGGD